MTRAGTVLGRTQPAISNSLRKLRDAFDDPLFVHDTQGLVPTPCAELLASRMVGIIAQTERCQKSDVRRDIAQSEAHFVMGAPDRLSLPLFLPLMRHVHTVPPN